MDAFYLSNKYVSPTSDDVWVKIRKRLEWICENWQLPDAGIWEMRNRQEHFVYSKVMNWVALDRGLRLADKRALPADHAKWIRERDRIYEEVMTQGWNEKRQAFTQFYGSEDLDASLLIMPPVFFMAPTDPRMLSTVNAILESPRDGGLVSDGLVYRYPPQLRIDGLPGEEGTFNMCSFWLVEALTRAGQADAEKLDHARLLFERVLGRRCKVEPCRSPGIADESKCSPLRPLSHAALRVFVAVFRPVRGFFRDAAAVFLALGAALAEESNSSLGCFEVRWWP